MLSNLTTEQILDLAYTKGQTFDAIAFAEKIAELEREACASLCEGEICACCWTDDAQAAAEHLATEIRNRLNIQTTNETEKQHGG